jgi:hypothetical protein
LRNRESLLTRTVAALLPEPAARAKKPPVFEPAADAPALPGLPPLTTEGGGPTRTLAEPAELLFAPASNQPESDRRPEHPLAPLLQRCRHRLFLLPVAKGGTALYIERGRAELAGIKDDRVWLGGDNPRLYALLEGLERHRGEAEHGFDLLMAHILTLLNQAFTAVTDAAELHCLVLLMRGGVG